MVKILFFGDVVGKSGRRAIAKVLPQLRAELKPDLVVVNAENLAHGKGVTLSTFRSMIEAGVDFFTSGNHVFDKPEITEVFAQYPDRVIRPANFEGILPSGQSLPGRGYVIVKVKEIPVAIINLNGQVFMEKQFDYGVIKNPFEALNKILDEIGNQTLIRILDFHAEATSEKRAMGFFGNGRLSAVLGTHTHIPTNDVQILSEGTGYLTDLGMVGAADSIIGVKTASALKRFLAPPASPEKIPLEIDESDKYEIDYAFLEIDEGSGKCKNIESKVKIENAPANQIPNE